MNKYITIYLFILFTSVTTLVAVTPIYPVQAGLSSGWNEITLSNGTLANDVYGGPGFYYNPTDMYLRPNQKIGFTINTYFLEVQVKFDNGNWQTVKNCVNSPCIGYLLADHPWNSVGVQSMAMRWRGEDGVFVNARTYTVYVVPLAHRAFQDNAGNTMVLWEGGNGTLDEPFVVVEGFDPTNDNFPEKYYQLGEDLFREARDFDQDMIVLNFAEGGGDLVTNAQYLTNAIKYINSIKSGVNEIKLAGVSMGGVICRYALAKAEDDGQALDVSHFASVDSPQKDAVIDRDLLDYMKSRSDDEGEQHASISSMAAKQMLRYNPYDSDGSIHTQFYNDLNSLNGDGYPNNTKNIGVSFSPNSPNPNSGKWLDLDVFAANWKEKSFYINSGDPIKEGGSFLPKENTVLWGRTWGFITYELERYTHPTFIPHESALDLNWSGNSNFDVPIFSDAPGFHNEVPQDIVSPLLQEMEVGTPIFSPDPPQNFEVTSEFSNYYDHPVSMEWDMVSGAEKYYVYRCRAYSTVGSCYNSWTHLLTSYGTSATDTQFYMDDGSSGDGAAMYRVRAVNTAGTSDPSGVEAIWVKDPSTTTYSKQAGEETDLLQIPEEIALGQSMPNPARGSAKIPVALPETSEISLVLYDITGREVAHLSDGQRPAGFYNVQFDTSTLPSGVYLYRLKAGNYTETRRMTIVR